MLHTCIPSQAQLSATRAFSQKSRRARHLRRPCRRREAARDRLRLGKTMGSAQTLPPGCQAQARRRDAAFSPKVAPHCAGKPHRGAPEAHAAKRPCRPPLSASLLARTVPPASPAGSAKNPPLPRPAAALYEPPVSHRLKHRERSGRVGPIAGRGPSPHFALSRKGMPLPAPAPRRPQRQDVFFL